jgi:hypothetical protein
MVLRNLSRSAIKSFRKEQCTDEVGTEHFNDTGLIFIE